MTFDDDQVRGTLRQLAATPDLEADWRHLVARMRADRRRRRVRSGVLAAAVLVAAGSALLLDRDAPVETGPSDPPTSEAVPGAPATIERAPNGLTLYGRSPLGARSDAAVVAAGDLVVVWGGSIEGPNVGHPDLGFATFDDGAYLDLAAGTWHAMSPAPLPPVEEVRPVAVWTGVEVLVFRGAHGAAWDPRSDTWRTLPPPPDPVTVAFWTGEEVIALGAEATYRDGDAGWTDLPAGPVAPTTLQGGAAVAAAWTGDELLVVSKTSTSVVNVASFDPDARTWRTLPPGDLSFGSTAVGVAWTGDELVVTGYDTDVVALDPRTERWRPLPSLPVQPQEGVPRLLTVDGRVVVHDPPGVGILDAGRWTVIPADAFPSSMPEPGPNGTVLTFGLTPDGESALGVFDPGRALRDLERVQIGFSILELGGAVVVEELSVEGTPPTITARVTTPDGECTVSHRLDGDFAPAVVACPSAEDADRLRARLSTPGL